MDRSKVEVVGFDHWQKDIFIRTHQPLLQVNNSCVEDTIQYLYEELNSLLRHMYRGNDVVCYLSKCDKCCLWIAAQHVTLTCLCCGYERCKWRVRQNKFTDSLCFSCNMYMIAECAMCQYMRLKPIPVCNDICKEIFDHHIDYALGNCWEYLGEEKMGLSKEDIDGIRKEYETVTPHGKLLALHVCFEIWARRNRYMTWDDLFTMLDETRKYLFEVVKEEDYEVIWV